MIFPYVQFEEISLQLLWSLIFLLLRHLTVHEIAVVFAGTTNTGQTFCFIMMTDGSSDLQSQQVMVYVTASLFSLDSAAAFTLSGTAFRDN